MLVTYLQLYTWEYIAEAETGLETKLIFFLFVFWKMPLYGSNVEKMDVNFILFFYFYNFFHKNQWTLRWLRALISLQFEKTRKYMKW